MDGVYDTFKDHLAISLYDYEENREWLSEIPHTRCGDFAAAYRVDVARTEDTLRCFPISKEVLDDWGVSVEQLHVDAIAAEMKRGPELYYLTEFLMKDLVPVFTPTNLLEMTELCTIKEGELLVLTNKDGMYGSALLMSEELLEQIGKITGKNYYVVPLNKDGTLILPSGPAVRARELNNILQECNIESDMLDNKLSDKVQYYDREARELVNAERYERTLQEKREAEQRKAESKERDRENGPKKPKR